MDKPVKPEPKKPYAPPKVIVYGTVRDLTLHIGRSGRPDNTPRNPRFNSTNV
jgi:hypothetical protein